MVDAWARLNSPAGRLAVLLTVLVVVALSLAVPLRTYIRQLDANAEIAASIEKRKQAVSELQAEVDRWDSDTYAQEQARERLHYVLPGENAYIVLGEDSDQPVLPKAGTTIGESAVGWYTRMWDSIDEARGQ